MSYNMTARHITSHHSMSSCVTSQHVTPRHTTADHMTPNHITRHQGIWDCFTLVLRMVLEFCDMTGKEMGFRGSGVSVPCVKAVRESDEWESTVTSSVHCRDFET